MTPWTGFIFAKAINAYTFAEKLHTSSTRPKIRKAPPPPRPGNR
jgi:hypothetical protein